ncbi:MAG: hypothetical protein RIQ79_1512 [Verrucomicrobiota bacterium]|jgi:hypothetical protein
MSEFSDALALAFDPAIAVFGETCTVDGNTYDCIPHATDGKENIRSGYSAGRSREVNGTLYIRGADWTTIKNIRTAAGASTKGIRVTTSAGTFRVINDPDISVINDTAEFQLGPLN